MDVAHSIFDLQDGHVARLPVLDSTIKQLYGSVSACAFPGCTQPLVRWIDGSEAPILNSRIAHISAASPNGPRFDDRMTDEERRAFDNLILLCLPHAEEIDLKALVDRYPLDTLMLWKTAQMESASDVTTFLPESLLQRAELVSMGDFTMDFRNSIIDLGGGPAAAPGAGGSGGGAIGPGARGGDGGQGGDHHVFTVSAAELLGEIPIEIGRPGRGGVNGMAGEAGGHTRFGSIVTPGGGREKHAVPPGPAANHVSTSVSSAVFANYAELTNGLVLLAGSGWGVYLVNELPAAFTGALCVWVDVSWDDFNLGNEIPLEVVVELVTPSRTATFSERASVTLAPRTPSGFLRHPFLFGISATAHDVGRHVLTVTTNFGSLLAQNLEVELRLDEASLK